MNEDPRDPAAAKPGSSKIVNAGSAQAAGPEVVSEKEILKTSLGDLQLEVLLKNLDVIWGFDFIQGHLIVGNLSGQHLRRLGVKGVKITDEESWLKDEAWRFRSLRTGPKGEIYFGTDEGRLARLQPVPKA